MYKWQLPYPQYLEVSAVVKSILCMFIESKDTHVLQIKLSDVFFNIGKKKLQV